MEYIGCSGFMYDHWRGSFYPEGLAKNKWFQYYIEYFNTVELNVTFYRLPKIETFRKWKEMTPKDFRFALKGSRYITHIRRLNDVAEAAEKFFNGALELGKKLSIVLWQLPPNFALDIEKLETFLGILKPYKVRNTFEFRHETWVGEETERLLKKYRCCYCMADWPPYLNGLPVTSTYAYIRRHGHGGSYDTNYSGEELKKDRRRIRSLQKKGVKDVYIFFNNDYMGYAPKNALILKKLINPK
jgi:uncharacterized protein YecE (DUF72 family)